RDDISAAAARIAGFVRRTPVLTLESGVVLKLELFQRAGSFKPRGAFNRVLRARDEGLLGPAGIIAASGGNHGAAVALVGHTIGVPTEVYVPSISSASKVARIRSFGVDVVIGGVDYDAAQDAANARQRVTGALLVHPYDHPDTVAGQGTMALELASQVPDADTVLVAVGGGGLIAGVASWYRGAVKVVSVEPVTIPAMERALAAGEPVEVEVSGLAADSLGARRVGAVPFACAAPFVHEAVLVSDDDIRAAQHELWDVARLAVEPGGAAAYAALVSGAYCPSPGERVVTVVCGSNVDPTTLA
ncbi:MAG: threonine dehydratase, partial [Acidimicrobiaceae bacterium]|nr:threonine dehydratase [Acidimicrobiaceae bacterium]